MIIYSYFIHQPDFSVDSNTKNSLEIDVEINTSRKVEAKSEMVKFNFTVPPFMQSDYILDSPIYTTFKLKLLGYDKFPTFAIRLKFVENLICLPLERLSNIRNVQMNRFAKHVIYMIEGNISDVYLSARHPYDELLPAMYYHAGYNGGTCRTIIKGHKCSHSKSHYQVIKIYYLPHKTLVTPQEIDISMKKTTNCSNECSLDIGILEYMQNVSLRKTRYHEWRKVYRITWQIITAKARGYIVTINSTCASCTQLCDIAVALGLPLTSNKVIPGTNNVCGKYLDLIRIIGDIEMASDTKLLKFNDFRSILLNITSNAGSITQSEKIYGSWHDAHSYCADRNSSLLTLHPSQSDHVLDIRKSHSWNSFNEYYFAGLHRADSVSITLHPCNM